MQIPLTVSDIIEIISIIITTFISLISIWIAVSTLKQNNKMIEESTRPYVVVYGVATNFQTPMYKIVVKNFGQSGAIITKFETDHDLINFNLGDKQMRPFKNICGTFIAPNQSFTCVVDYLKMKENEIKIINFKISYMHESKTYNESINLNISAETGLLSYKASTQNKELEIISYALQELVDKNL